ncbi:MAG TPA: hypothetical protein VEU96_16480 [Bryobacteraceae bacterium]|nr:hypothetical protein [Bryobacteraceae bacterium]
MRTAFVLSALLVASAWAQQPLVYNRAVVNAASFVPQGIPGGGIARGSIFSIFGNRFGPASGMQVSAFPLATTLGGVSITITQGNTTVNAIPLYASNTQVNAIMPSNAPLGMASLRVVNGAIKGNPVPVRIVDNAVGIFTATQAGVGPGILQNFVTADNQPINAPTLTAQAGQVITLYGTGLGPAPNGIDTTQPTASNLPTPVEVFVGGKSASLLYHGRSPCCAGLDQIVFQVPADAPLGCWVPVFVRTAGATVSNAVTMAIQSDTSTCSEPLNRLASAIVNGGKAGAFVAVRASTHEDIGTRSPIDVTVDYHAAILYDMKSSLFPFNAAVSLPPAGTCTTYSVAGDLLAGDLLPGGVPSARLLDAGPAFNLTGPRGARTLTSVVPPYRIGYLGGAITGNLFPGTLFLDPGAYTLSGFGGADVGAFQASLNVPQPLTWTNRDQIMTVSRSQPLTISWTGGTDQQVGIVGFGEDLPTNASTSFVCVAQQGSTSFTIPPYILSNLPATRRNILQSKSVIYFVSVPRSGATPFTASGLDAGVAMFAYINGKTVVFQ